MFSSRHYATGASLTGPVAESSVRRIDIHKSKVWWHATKPLFVLPVLPVSCPLQNFYSPCHLMEELCTCTELESLTPLPKEVPSSLLSMKGKRLPTTSFPACHTGAAAALAAWRQVLLPVE
jgi:hypothetical protein